MEKISVTIYRYLKYFLYLFLKEAFYLTIMPKRTYQPNTRRASKKHGFFARMATKAGRNILKRRRLKGREQLTK